jgi:hypothetical protein
MVSQSEDIHSQVTIQDDIPDSILKYLNEFNQPILVICNHEYDDNVIKQESEDKYGSYILLHQTGDVLQDIRSQLIRLKSNSAWNARAQFVVAIMHPVGSSPQNRAKVKTENAQIFAEFWRHNVVEVILLQSVHFFEENVPVNRGTPTIEVYTWFPYFPSGQCAQTTDGVLLDMWVTKKDGVGYFLHNVSLFPPKIPRYLPGCPIRISTFEFEPVVMYPWHSEDGNTLLYKGGLEIEMLKMIQKATNMSTVFRQRPSDATWGVLLDNGSWTGVLREVIEGVSDMAFGAVFYRCHISSDVIECTTPYIFDKIIWYVPCAQPNPRWTSLSRVFKLSLWLGFILGYIIMSVLIWVIVKVSNMAATVGNESLTYTNLTKCFLNLWAVILGVSATEDIPKNAVIRIVFLLWVMYSLAVNTVYQTFLTSYMVDPGQQHQISSVDELLDSRLDYGMVDTLEELLPDLKAKRYDRRQICDDIEVCVRRAALKGDYAFLHSKVSTDYMAAVRYVDSNGDPMFCQLDETFSRQYITTTVQKGSPMLARYNDVIQRVIEGGILDQWWRQLKFQATLSAARNFTVPVGDYVPLSIEHLQSPFYVLILGCAIPSIFFLIEMFSHKRSRK